MRVLIACVLLLFAIPQAARAGKPAAHIMFADWLEQQTTADEAASAKTAAAVPSYYKQAETETACFKEIGQINCRCIGCTDYCDQNSCGGSSPLCCKTYYAQSQLGCCQESGDGGDHERQNALPGLDNLDIGLCEFTVNSFPLPEPVYVSENVLKVASFTASCNLHSGSQCGHPFCDSMVLTQTGVMYYLYAAVSKTNPNPAPLDESCNQEFGRKGPGGFLRRSISKEILEQLRKSALGRKPAAANKANKANTTDASIAVEASYVADGPRTFFQTDATIASGPVTITSRKYDIKYHEGQMDYVYWWHEDAVEISAAEAAGKHLVNPFAYTLQLKQPLEQY